MYFFTADEHYGHYNIIKYCNRPFNSVEEMDYTIIDNHNKVVNQQDITIHAGDFTLKQKDIANNYIKKLNGSHIFLGGSHDRWLSRNVNTIWEKEIDNQYVIVCHYAMRTWARSHYNSWQLYGHSHGRLMPIGKQWDIGVDNNNFFPLSFDEIKSIMASQPNNLNYLKV